MVGNLDRDATPGELGALLDTALTMSIWSFAFSTPSMDAVDAYLEAQRERLEKQGIRPEDIDTILGCVKDGVTCLWPLRGGA